MDLKSPNGDSKLTYSSTNPLFSAPSVPNIAATAVSADHSMATVPSSDSTIMDSTSKTSGTGTGVSGSPPLVSSMSDLAPPSWLTKSKRTEPFVRSQSLSEEAFAVPVLPGRMRQTISTSADIVQSSSMTMSTSGSSTLGMSSSKSSDADPQKHDSDTPLVERKRRHRTTYSQLMKLEKVFSTESVSPDRRRREELCAELDMSHRSVQIWFQNRRAKERRRISSRQQEDQGVGSSDSHVQSFLMGSTIPFHQLRCLPGSVPPGRAAYIQMAPGQPEGSAYHYFYPSSVFPGRPAGEVPRVLPSYLHYPAPRYLPYVLGDAVAAPFPVYGPAPGGTVQVPTVGRGMVVDDDTELPRDGDSV